MKSHHDRETQKQIMQCIDLLKNIIGIELLAVYLYGSSIVGGLQKYSDIDLFVVLERSTSSKEKARLVKDLLQISGIYMEFLKMPIEMTIVVKSEINPWHYPPHFDFQYGDWFRKEFEAGNIEPWSTKEMPDLAIIITQILLASEVLFGPSPDQLLCRVPYRDFIAATKHAIPILMNDLNSDTRNVLLTLARIWSILNTDTLCSKTEAAVWVIERLPEKYQAVMKRAKDICMGEENENWNDIIVLIKPCSDFMVEQIYKEILAIEKNKNANRVIKKENGGAHHASPSDLNN
jgi:streptomycin 3"-adenylyltransferase